MHQRTRVIQRNVRMILILVDGQSTVADLCLKTGNPQLTENALMELEKSGLIQPLVEQDSLWAESKKVAQEIRAAAIDKAIQFASPKPAASAPAVKPVMPEYPVFVDSGFPTPAVNELPLSDFSIAQIQSGQLPDDDKEPVSLKDTAKKSASGKARTSSSTPSFIERLRLLVPRSDPAKKNSVSIKPIRRGPRSSMGWPLIVLSGVMLTIVLGFLTITFFPYGSYLPDIERVFSQASGRDVKVGAMKVSVYPDPGLILGDVRIGLGNEELSVSEIRLQPEIGSLFEPKMLFRKMVLNGARLPVELVGTLSSVLATAALPTSRVGVQYVSFEKAAVSIGGLGIPDLEGAARLSEAGELLSLSLYSLDRSLNIETRLRAPGVEVTLNGLGWKPYQSSPFLFDSISVKGRSESGAFSIGSMELRLFDGLIQGSAVLRNDAARSISGELVFERLNVSRLGAALGLGQQFSGDTAGNVRFSASADSWAAIFSAINADGEFSMRRGNIQGVDLAEAVRRVSNTPVQGGATMFEQLTGKIRLTPMNYQFLGLVMDSGLMQSTGFVSVSKELNVSGKMDLQMQGSVNKTRVPVSISGPLRTPSVQAGRG